MKDCSIRGGMVAAGTRTVPFTFIGVAMMVVVVIIMGLVDPCKALQLEGPHAVLENSVVDESVAIVGNIESLTIRNVVLLGQVTLNIVGPPQTSDGADPFVVLIVLDNCTTADRLTFHSISGQSVNLSGHVLGRAGSSVFFAHFVAVAGSTLLLDSLPRVSLNGLSTRRAAITVARGSGAVSVIDCDFRDSSSLAIQESDATMLNGKFISLTNTTFGDASELIVKNNSLNIVGNIGPNTASAIAFEPPTTTMGAVAFDGASTCVIEGNTITLRGTKRTSNQDLGVAYGIRGTLARAAALLWRSNVIAHAPPARVVDVVIGDASTSPPTHVVFSGNTLSGVKDDVALDWQARPGNPTGAWSSSVVIQIVDSSLTMSGANPPAQGGAGDAIDSVASVPSVLKARKADLSQFGHWSNLVADQGADSFRFDELTMKGGRLSNAAMHVATTLTLDGVAVGQSSLQVDGYLTLLNAPRPVEGVRMSCKRADVSRAVFQGLGTGLLVTNETRSSLSVGQYGGVRMTSVELIEGASITVRDTAAYAVNRAAIEFSNVSFAAGCGVIVERATLRAQSTAYPAAAYGVRVHADTVFGDNTYFTVLDSTITMWMTSRVTSAPLGFAHGISMQFAGPVRLCLDGIRARNKAGSNTAAAAYPTSIVDVQLLNHLGASAAATSSSVSSPGRVFQLQLNVSTDGDWYRIPGPNPPPDAVYTVRTAVDLRSGQTTHAAASSDEQPIVAAKVSGDPRPTVTFVDVPTADQPHFPGPFPGGQRLWSITGPRARIEHARPTASFFARHAFDDVTLVNVTVPRGVSLSAAGALSLIGTTVTGPTWIHNCTHLEASDVTFNNVSVHVGRAALVRATLTNVTTFLLSGDSSGSRLTAGHALRDSVIESRSVLVVAHHRIAVTNQAGVNLSATEVRGGGRVHLEGLAMDVTGLNGPAAAFGVAADGLALATGARVVLRDLDIDLARTRRAASDSLGFATAIAAVVTHPMRLSQGSSFVLEDSRVNGRGQAPGGIDLHVDVGPAGTSSSDPASLLFQNVTEATSNVGTNVFLKTTEDSPSSVEVIFSKLRTLRRHPEVTVSPSVTSRAVLGLVCAMPMEAGTKWGAFDEWPAVRSASLSANLSAFNMSCDVASDLPQLCGAAQQQHVVVDTSVAHIVGSGSVQVQCPSNNDDERLVANVLQRFQRAAAPDSFTIADDEERDISSALNCSGGRVVLPDDDHQSTVPPSSLTKSRTAVMHRAPASATRIVSSASRTPPVQTEEEGAPDDDVHSSRTATHVPANGAPSPAPDASPAPAVESVTRTLPTTGDDPILTPPVGEGTLSLSLAEPSQNDTADALRRSTEGTPVEEGSAASEATRSVAASATTLVAAVSVAGLGASTVASASRLQSLTYLARCTALPGSLAEDDLDRIEFPLYFQLGGLGNDGEPETEVSPAVYGGLASNAALVAVAAAAGALAMRVADGDSTEAAKKQSGHTDDDTLATAAAADVAATTSSLPSASWRLTVPAVAAVVMPVYFGPPMISVGLRAMVAGLGATWFIALCTIIAVASALPIVYASAHVLRFATLSSGHVAANDTAHRMAPVHLAWPPAMRGVAITVGAVVVQGLRVKPRAALAFVAVDGASAFLIAATSAIADCRVRSIAALAVAGAYAGYLLVLRPAANRIEHAILLAAACVQLGGVAAAVVRAWSSSPQTRAHALAMADALILISACLLLLQPVLLLLLEGYEAWRGRGKADSSHAGNVNAALLADVPVRVLSDDHRATQDGAGRGNTSQEPNGAHHADPPGSAHPVADEGHLPAAATQHRLRHNPLLVSA